MASEEGPNLSAPAPLPAPVPARAISASTSALVEKKSTGTSDVFQLSRSRRPATRPASTFCWRTLSPIWMSSPWAGERCSSTAVSRKRRPLSNNRIESPCRAAFRRQTSIRPPTSVVRMTPSSEEIGAGSASAARSGRSTAWRCPSTKL